MSNVLLVNATSSETRVALVENGILSELHIERNRERGIVGNIYKGKVVRVLPGMQAAFVDISHERAGFLHASDIYDFGDDVSLVEEDGDEDEEENGNANGGGNGRRRSRTSKVAIQESLDKNQEVLLQVAKEPMGTKGARMTSHASLPGRYVVFMPTVSHIGISKRIGSDKERRRLRKIVEKTRPKGTGFIVRTSSEGIDEDKLVNDMQMLIKLWNEIIEKHNRVKAPYLLYEEPDLAIRAVRDLVSADIQKIVIDDSQVFEQVRSFVETYMPGFEGEVELYERTEPIFDEYGIEVEIQRSLKREVPLKSGGSIVIDRAEALTAIDVNTGKFVGKGTSLDDTILQTNIEAAEEVVYQLRLRNIGGLIIIDLIDMENPKHREKVYRTLEKALQKDRATTNALAISEFGLVEMTRKRTREALEQLLCESCHYCDGRGFVKTRETVAYEAIRMVKREAPIGKDPLTLRANPQVVDFLRQTEKKALQKIEQQYERKIHLKSDGNLNIEVFHLETKP